ncbi:protein phosphatase 2C domain-containing protein [Actinomadura sp. NPDC048032]|uniref:PP2C family protein-serine/threonine phosphatase n=1 Tax=Actinomadura sp. NPDC048032 TaxID=3155747 RepID=UPI0033C6D35E
MSFTVEAAARTHVGLVRRRNEDSVYAGKSLFAVADGLGGHVAGDTASATAIQALRRYDRLVAEADLVSVAGQAVSAANTALRNKIEAEPELAGMGTTLVAMLWSGSKFVLANVGDSRGYLLRASRTPQMIPITEDHIYGNLMSDAASVPHLPERLARFLDGRPDGRSPDLTTRNLQAGDRFLLCSDGLSPVVPNDLIQARLASSTNSGGTADHLISLAIDHGGPDNVTVIVMDVRDPNNGAT